VRVGRILPKHRRDQLFTSSKSTKITKEGFLKQLETSLVKLNTDYLDCYMLHKYSAFVEWETIPSPSQEKVMPGVRSCLARTWPWPSWMPGPNSCAKAGNIRCWFSPPSAIPSQRCHGVGDARLRFENHWGLGDVIQRPCWDCHPNAHAH